MLTAWLAVLVGVGLIVFRERAAASAFQSLEGVFGAKYVGREARLGELVVIFVGLTFLASGVVQLWYEW